MMTKGVTAGTRFVGRQKADAETSGPDFTDYFDRNVGYIKPFAYICFTKRLDAIQPFDTLENPKSYWL